jgi:hypothetical protein
VEFRYYLNPETGLPHIYDHGVTEGEAEWILTYPGEDEACSNGSRQSLRQTADGRRQTADGRYLRVIYVPDEEGNGVFVVTAYPLAGNQLNAFRRRQRRRRR